ncbi:MAG: signal peptidase I [Butyricicoccus pullicaecorum]|nr:signal peptidase I [Butyricicoccus pullicaecorum]
MKERQPFEEQEEKKKGRFQSSLYDWGEALIISLIFIVLLFTFVVRLIGVDGSSMFPTLHDRDVMAVSNLGYTPEKGDIVVLNKESFMDGPIVKRVIATEGDEIDIDFALGRVYVNGEELDEPYTNEFTLPMNEGGMTFPQTVPEGCIFVMGDNRNASTDSRDPALGMVDERYVIGHVLAVVWPFENFGGKTA